MSNDKVDATFYDPIGEATRRYIDLLIDEIHDTAVRHGWWEGERNMGEILTNVHSEITEAWEEYRDGRPLDEVRYAEDGKPEGFPIELADAVIRIMDICARYQIDLYGMIRTKMDYNHKRPYRHGGKLA